MVVRGTTSRSWVRGVTALSWVAFAVLIGHGCVTTQTPGPGEVPTQPPDPTIAPEFPKDCPSRQAMERFLVDTTVAAAAAYGRIDPYLYVVSATGGIEIDPQAQPLDPNDVANARDLLERLNEDRFARAMLTKNIGRAQKLCKDQGCPDQAVYRFQADPGNSELKQRFALTGPAQPTGAEQQAFLLLSDMGRGDCQRAVEMKFEGASLLIARTESDCAKIRDCHEANDAHNPKECCSEYTAEGEWKDRRSPFGMRHCCD